MRLHIGQAPYDAHLHLKLPGGDAGVFATLWAMKAFVDDAVERSPTLERAANKIRRVARAVRVPGTAKNTPALQLAHAVYEFLRCNVKFRRDPQGLEHVRHPDQLLNEINRRGV